MMFHCYQLFDLDTLEVYEVHAPDAHLLFNRAYALARLKARDNASCNMRLVRADDGVVLGTWNVNPRGSLVLDIEESLGVRAYNVLWRCARALPCTYLEIRHYNQLKETMVFRNHAGKRTTREIDHALRLLYEGLI